MHLLAALHYNIARESHYANANSNATVGSRRYSCSRDGSAYGGPCAKRPTSCNYGYNPQPCGSAEAGPGACPDRQLRYAGSTSCAIQSPSRGLAVPGRRAIIFRDHSLRRARPHLVDSSDARRRTCQPTRNCVDELRARCKQAHHPRIERIPRERPGKRDGHRRRTKAE